jgi:hypothetical protein
VKSIEFSDEGPFAALNAARAYLQEEGYSVGSPCNTDPIGVKRGQWDIAKWRNLSSRDKALLDGRLEGNFRNGPVTLVLKA